MSSSALLSRLGVVYDASRDSMYFTRRFSSSSIEYRQQKEAFVSDMSGSTAIELVAIVYIIIMINILHNFAWRILCRIWPRFTDMHTLCFALHFIDTPCVLIILMCASNSIGPLLLFITMSIGVLIVVDNKILSKKNSTRVLSLNIRKNIDRLNQSRRKRFITLYRSGFMLSTCVAILAVDFQTFPRRFVKTETFGFSLMDTGVGFVVFSSGVVRASSSSSSSSLLRSLMSRFSSITPLIVLGFIRLATIRSLDYQTHTSEYGVHWNFFFTLAAISLIDILLPIRSLISAISIIIFYQFALSTTSLQHYILNAPRLDFISANREGLFSCIGYFVLFSIGSNVGAHLRTPASPSQWWRRASCYTITALICLIATSFSPPISRRLVNLPYVMWMCGLNLLALVLLLLADMIECNISSHTSPILHAINRNQLAVFLLSNQLTGVINLTTQTLYANTHTSIIIIVAYLFIVCGTATLLDDINVTLKFW